VCGVRGLGVMGVESSELRVGRWGLWVMAWGRGLGVKGLGLEMRGTEPSIPARVLRLGLEGQGLGYRGTSLIRNNPLPEPYRRNMFLWCS